MKSEEKKGTVVPWKNGKVKTGIKAGGEQQPTEPPPPETNAARNVK